MKNIRFALGALVCAASTMVAGVGIAQEHSAGGTQEVQASFSALKAAIKTVDALARAADKKAVDAQDTADQAVRDAGKAQRTADKAQTTADRAETLAENMRVCSARQKFYDKQDATRDGQNCVNPMDSVAGARFVGEKKATRAASSKDDDYRTVTDRQDPMILNVSCVVQSGGCGGFSGNVSVFMGKKGGHWDEFLQGGHEQALANDCGKEGSRPPAVYETLSETFYVHKGVMYQGAIIPTLAGPRMLGKKKFMDYADWNGQIKYKGCIKGSWGATLFSY